MLNNSRPTSKVLQSVLALLFSFPTYAAFDPAGAFDKKCSSCHSIGAGVIKGPDLKDVKTRRAEPWLIKFIQSSDAMIKSGDAQAVKIYNEFKQMDMPDQKLTDSEVVELLQFIESGKVQEPSLTAKSALNATDEEKSQGRDLFLGITPLKNGGVACVSCHSAGSHGALGGGTLAKDLTHVYSSYKDNGLSVALKKLAFPVMEEVFLNKSLTDEESYQLKAFFYQEDMTGSPLPNSQKKFLFLGASGLVLAMGVIDFSWRRRRKNSVRRFRGGLR